MGSLLIGVKRFLKNKNTVTIFAILLSLGILYYAYYYRIQKATEPVSVPYATREIGPRTLITSDLISVRKVPGGVVNNNVIKSKNQIVGKYVNNTAVIPEGGLFYDDMVVEWDELPTSLFSDIQEGNTVVLIPVTLEKTYGNSIYPGNYIDLYFQSWKEEGKVRKLFLGKFIESIRVLAVTDGAGNNVFETNDKPGTPQFLMFSVPEDMHILLRKALAQGYEIIPVPRNAAYSEEPLPTRIVNNEIKRYIEDSTVDSNIVYNGGISR